jgi:lysophospholipase L1-like esterase
MSDDSQSPTFERSPLFRPRTFLAGLIAGLALCSALARYVSYRGYHDTFTRFHIYIAPEGQYYPTLDEMGSIVRTRCRSDQVLVIVGGNSIFNGVGQPVEKLWSNELQRLLGDGYAVVNLAFRGAYCTDGGAIVAEVLRKEFPRQIYVANTGPFVQPEPIGSQPYRYLIWEARSRGLLEEFPAREKLLAESRRMEYTRSEWVDLLAGTYLDRVLRFRDLWNWIGYKFIFTIQNPITPNMPQAIWARERFDDIENDFEDTPLNLRFLPEYRDAEMKIVRGFSGTYYTKDSSGNWTLKPNLVEEFNTAAAAAFPKDLRARTLIMLSRNCPLYLHQLTPDEMLREDDAYRDGIRAWKALGYGADEYGRDYDESDFGDRTHLTGTGGRKLAARVAADVQAIASKLGYLGKGTGAP